MWWKEAVFYELYMPSFKDGDGDGKGDFKGITGKLDYLGNLGIDAIWLTPFYKSPKVDNGYDISDYYSVDPDYGTMADFELFMEEAHGKGLKVVADLVLNHTSNLHPWFLESASGKDSPKRDWYIWRDRIPNNWESFFGGPAWEYDSVTGEYYYHKFAKEQVDLNWTNPEVRGEARRVMKFWMEKGIDGFRLDVINFLSTGDDFSDNPSDENGKQLHEYDINRKGVLEAIREIRDFVHSHEGKVLIGEVGSDDLSVLKNYQGEDKLDLVFNFNLGSMKKFDVNRIVNELKNMEEEMPGLATLFFSSHDMPRQLSRFDDPSDRKGRAKALAALSLLLRGVPFVYFGEEIGMTDLIAENAGQINDVQARTRYRLALEEGKTEEQALKEANGENRDKSRSPMQWDSSSYGGFSEVRPWLRLNSDYLFNNVASQETDSFSILNFYRELIRLRRSEPALCFGSYNRLDHTSDMICFEKVYGNDKILCVINFGEEIALMETGLDDKGKVLLGNREKTLKRNCVLIIRK